MSKKSEQLAKVMTHFGKTERELIEEKTLQHLYEILKTRELFTLERKGQKNNFVVLDNLTARSYFMSIPYASKEENRRFLWEHLKKNLWVENNSCATQPYTRIGNMLATYTKKLIVEIGKKAGINIPNQLMKSVYGDLANNIGAKVERVDVLKSLSQNKYHNNLVMLDNWQTVLNEIPSDMTLLFPAARKLKRHFILHIGDTNTGKTYQAVQDFLQAETGVYLAPLRLLALETQEKAMGERVLCSLLTGEEEDLVNGAKHISSTVEMLNTNTQYDVCIIDEAQMIADSSRGWAWTKAILGACAKRIHICMSENAKDIVTKLIKSCGDTYEVVEHTRNTQLVFEEERFCFPKDVKKHDALIVFSKRDVLGVAAELSDAGMKVSVIYGALPYSVRKNEMQRFLNGETDIVVSTDAIGMGVNLPIKRVVFLQSTKYDGKCNRYLTGPEIKQIAGRAGRRGMYETGYVNCSLDRRYLKNKLFEPYKPIQKARIQIPEHLISLNIKLSEIIRQWIQIADEELYEKADIESLLEKCLYLETLNNLSKQEMWKFMSIPFDERNAEIYNLWKMLVKRYLNEDDIGFDLDEFLSMDTQLAALEQNYRILDLYFSFSRCIGYDKDNFRKRIVEKREKIATDMMKLLSKPQNQTKKCRTCGVKLPWNYPYGLCNDCYSARRFYCEW